ncbi:unnamed protein product [Somion occarium]|uniref:Elongator complex protein 1 n=2 Tax=Somion occarium TaxID=3059160 RepID=A0ABP1DV34_9APHY
MRNLSLLGTTHHTHTPTLGESISAVTFDLDESALFTATEHVSKDGDVQVKVWKIEGNDGLGSDDILSNHLVTIFTSSAYLKSNPWSSPHEGPAELVSFKILPDTRTLAFIMRGGDIATASLSEGLIEVDIVGSIEAGIAAASWSPDDSLVVLATADEKLILMTSTFDVVSETTLHPSDFGEDAPINVGWGSKQTQFHGSLGKAAAQAPKPTLVGASPDDDTLPRISWRGDGAYFVVSSLSPVPADPENPLRHRTLRVYSHAGILQNTSEPTPGFEHTLSWRPLGNWIVGTQRYGFEGGGIGREGRHDLVMFERNGLRRGEFGIEKMLWNGQVSKDSEMALKWGYRVREVGWSSDSNILSIWIERDEGDVVQLWTTGNYHWYLKHEIAAPPDHHGKAGRFTAVVWHPEDALKLILTTQSRVVQRTYVWETFASRCKPSNDSGSVAVLDGASILLTPFRPQNVPPPMSAYQLALSSSSSSSGSSKTSHTVPIHVSFSPRKDVLTVLQESGYLEVIDLHTRLGPGRGKVMDHAHLWAGAVAVNDSSTAYRQVIQWAQECDASDIIRLAALGSDTNDFISVLTLAGSEVNERYDVGLPERNGRLLYTDQSLSWQGPDGQIYDYDISEKTFLPSAKLPDFCSDAECVNVHPEGRTSGALQDQSVLYVGLSQGNKLSVANSQTSQTLASNVNSFFIASDFLIFTTTAHVAQFAPLEALKSLLESPDPNSPIPEWETRRVERGSRIVTAVPTTMSLVLQMPRGNLETIYPRPLVMKIVKQDFNQKQYAKAFSACRRHRVDLNVFLEYNREAFMADLTLFIDQVDDVDNINLFLTSIGQGSLPSEVVAHVCDGIRLELEKRDLKKYISSILTAHVMKRPPDHESALSLLLRLRDTEPQLVEDAVKYIIFLVDADKLFDTALGMYDFSLVLMVAQNAQKDPREYLPFLRELRALDKYYQHFRIDDHLKRYEKALKDLSQAGPERFDEAMSYVEKHQLYDAALTIWRDTDHYKTVLSIYGDWLFERREFRDAAFVFRHAGKPAKAMIAYEKSLDWRELFEIALDEKVSEEDLNATAYRVAEDLSSKKRYADAAHVLLDYAKDIREAVISLVQGNHFSEARRIIALHSLPTLLEEVIYPAALESRVQIAEDLGEMKEQLRKQVQRLRELRVKKAEEPDAFYGVEDTDLHNVDVMTDISMAPTAFTRYTQAPSSVSRTSKRSSRSKRKMERKIGSGRKGTVDEEEYLLKSVTKLVGRFNTTQAEAISLLPHLFQFSEEHREEGLALQQELMEFEEELKQAVEDIWKKKSAEAEGAEPFEDGWAARMQEYEKQRQIDPLDKVARPDLMKRDWNPKLSIIGNKSK